MKTSRFVPMFLAGWLAFAPGLAMGIGDDVRHDATVDAVRTAMPSVVSIGTESLVEVHDAFEDTFRQFYGPFFSQIRPQQYQWANSLGSGVIIDEDGYILTNEHVVKRARRIQVKLSEEAGGEEFEAELVNSDPKTDVALLKIIPNAKLKTRKFNAIRLAKDDDLLLGETVLALGNPFGLGGSVSRGILSAKRAKQQVEPTSDTQTNSSNLLQTDASINPGNSGGPIVNIRGDLIGINSAILSGAQGIGFAIPVKEIRQSLAALFIPEYNGRWFGARVTVGGALVRVEEIESGGPADKSGLRVGDVIMEVNNKPVRGFEFSRQLRDGPARDYTLTVQRSGEVKTLNLRLLTFAELVRQRMGLDAQELTGSLAKQFGLQDHAGILIAGIEKGGPAEKADLQSYFVITGIDGGRVNSLLNAAAAVYSKEKGGTVDVSVLIPQTQNDIILGYRQGVARLKLR